VIDRSNTPLLPNHAHTAFKSTCKWRVVCDDRAPDPSDISKDLRRLSSM